MLARALVAARAPLAPRGVRSFNKRPNFEAWNGFREDTHKTWTVNSNNSLSGIILVGVIPAFFYWASAVELDGRGKRDAVDGKVYRRNGSV